MSPLEAATLGAIQGLTEFLPISSSAHLYVVPRLLGWSYGGISFDVALHMGTLAALLLAFWRDWWNLARDLFGPDPARRADALGMLGKLAAASVPAAVVGLVFEDAAYTHFRHLPLQAAMLTVFGFLLWWVDRRSPHDDTKRTPGWKTAMFIGAAQALSLVPGVSRSGVTMTAARASHMTRVQSARFSFLLATPITLGAGLLEMRRLDQGPPLGIVAIGVATSAIVGVLAIHGLIRWLGRAGFGAFFVYRAALALVVVVQWMRL